MAWTYERSGSAHRKPVQPSSSRFSLELLRNYSHLQMLLLRHKGQSALGALYISEDYSSTRGHRPIL